MYKMIQSTLTILTKLAKIARFAIFANTKFCHICQTRSQVADAYFYAKEEQMITLSCLV
jgi:hypothetical protein